MQAAMGAKLEDIRAYSGSIATSETVRKLFRGELPVEDYGLLVRLLNVEGAISNLLHKACNMHGVIDEVPVPIGQLPKKDTSLVRAIRGAYRYW